MNLEEFGAVIFGVHDEPDTRETGGSLAIERTISVFLDFDAASFSSAESTLKLIRSSISDREGELVITDESDQLLFKHHVRVLEMDVPEDWRQFSGRCTFKFHARVVAPERGIAFLGITPPGGTMLRLHGVRSYSENMRVEYHDEDAAIVRREVKGITVSGRHYAQPGLDLALRRAELIALRQRIEAAASEPGLTLLWAGESREVQPEQVSADFPGDSTDYLEWSLQLRQTVYPSGSYVECRFRVVEDEDEKEGVERLTVSGTIRASDKAIAMDKAAKLKAHYGAGRRYIGHSKEEDRVTDLDTDDITGQCIEIAFTYRFETESSALTWDFTIQTRDDSQSGERRIIYAGTVKGATLAALSKARELGDDKYPAKLRSDTTVGYEKTVSEDQRIRNVQFSYEYKLPSTVRYVDVTVAQSDEHYAVDTVTVSGTVTADSLVNAKALANTFKQTGLLVESENLTERKSGPAGAVEFVSLGLDFRYSKGKKLAQVAIEFGTTTETDYSATNKTTVTVAGVVYGAGREFCKKQARALALAEATAEGIALKGKVTRESFTPRFKKEGSTSVLEGYEFQIQYGGTVDPDPGSGENTEEDLRSAELSITFSYGHQRKVITPIPGKDAEAHVQSDLGWVPGSVSITGSSSAKKVAAPRTWAENKIRGVNADGGTMHLTENPRITERTVFDDAAGKQEQSVVVDFSATWTVIGMHWS